MLITKKRSQFEGVARHFALVSDNDGITILGFASRPLLNACASLLLHQQWWGDAGTRRSELHKWGAAVNCCAKPHFNIKIMYKLITSQLLHLFVVAIIKITMTNITIVNTCAVLWHPLRTLFVGIVPEKKRLHLGANLVRTFCQNSHCPFFFTPSPFPHKP